MPGTLLGAVDTAVKKRDKVLALLYGFINMCLWKLRMEVEGIDHRDNKETYVSG